jgi:hypothetical protein
MLKFEISLHFTSTCMDTCFNIHYTSVVFCLDKQNFKFILTLSTASICHPITTILQLSPPADFPTPTCLNSVKERHRCQR